MDARERFFEVRDALGLTDYRIYTDVDGVTKSMLDRLRQGVTTDVSTKWLIPFLEAYPQVNANYILTGRGSKFIEPDVIEKNKVLEKNFMNIARDFEKSQMENIELKKELAETKAVKNLMEKENAKLREELTKSMSAEFFRQEADFYKEKAENLVSKLMEMERIIRSLQMDIDVLKSNG